MLFITNREPVKTEHSKAYDFNLRKNAPSCSIYCCERMDKGHYIKVGSQGLMARLKESKAQQILLYLHGFSNLPEPDIFPRAIKLQQYFDSEEPNLVEVVPLIWPCDNDMGIIKDYWDDQKSADMSAFSFARALQLFMAWRAQSSGTCLKRINVLAHSMGNRVLRQTLAAWDKYDLSNGVPLLFRNSFLMAADITNDSLEEGQDGRLISQASRNVCVYYANDDLALRASKIANLKHKIASQRLGHTGPEDMKKVQSNVYTIDCDNFNNQYDMPKGHSYFLGGPDSGKAGKVFSHMCACIKDGRVPVTDPAKREQIL